MSRTLPLVSYGIDRFVAHYRGHPVSVAEFIGNARRLADALPAHQHVVNLCEDRYQFMLGLAAAMLRGQITLMPPNRTSGTVNSLSERYPDLFYLSPESIPAIGFPGHLLQDLKAPACSDIPEVDVDALVAITFTSGSTGEPQANLKYWGDLVTGANLARQRFAFCKKSGGTLVATVPAQHMYGLESSILAAWHNELSVHHGRPFFPVDVRNVLAAMPAPRVLVTTPTHLRACIAADLAWPAIDCVISATAPLSVSLASQAEQIMRTCVKEIYGSTETGAVASRRTVEQESWRLYDGLRLSRKNGDFIVSGGHLRAPTPLADQLESIDFSQFRLLGRNADMIKIAGKRASLSELNLRLMEINGVKDGVIFLPEGNDAGRLTALVVAPGLNEKFLLKQLANSVDPAFLPRPLYLVDFLPRNESGKLPRQHLQEFVEHLTGSGRLNKRVVE